MHIDNISQSPASLPPRPITRTFELSGTFQANAAAEHYLGTLWFSIGPMQGNDPRGFRRGKWTISKWRGMSERDRRLLHGQITGDMRNGPVTIELFPTAPAEAVAAFHREG